MALAARFAASQPFTKQDDMREPVNGYTESSEPQITSSYNSDYEPIVPKVQVSRSNDDGGKSLTTRESVELFQETVDQARQNIQQSLAGTGKASDLIRPKLTVDLSRRNLASLPTEVVSIIKNDVERLQLAHNQLRFISPDFSSCTALKYLNLRDNRFHEIPMAIFGLPQIEILDLSRNHLTEIPKEISNLKALRVFSFHHNKIEDLPPCLGSINTLRILKLNGNPLKSEIIETITGSDNIMSPSTPALPDNDNEKDRVVTARLVEYLRSKQTSQDDFGETPMETPRAVSRFPVHPNDSGYLTSGSESNPVPRSPAFPKPPRAHHRGSSSHYSASQTQALRRPGLAPLALSNERNRSNSESVLQATQATRSKRMGIVPSKKQAELEVLDENKASRNSFHLRGQSHSSALRNVARPGETSTHDETPRNSGQHGTFIRRLSSVPEQRQTVNRNLQDNFVECAKGVLYALHLVQPYLSTLVSVIQDDSAKRSSLERFQYQASVQLEHLDQSLHDWSGTTGRTRNARKAARKTVSKATLASILVYNQISGLLLKNVQQLVANGDRRYIRTLMLMLYGGINEERNARRQLLPPKALPQPPTRSNTTPVLAISTNPPNRDDAMTPTQHNSQSDGRWRSDSGEQRRVQDNVGGLNAAAAASHKTAPAQSNVSSRSTSRSNSRAGFYFPSTASSIASTPLSADSFNTTVLDPRSRSGSFNVNPERKRQEQFEQDLFERIYVTLSKAADQGLQVIPYLEPRFVNSLEASRKQWLPVNVLNLWNTIINRTRHCKDMSEALKLRLQSVKLNDAEARNSQDFWVLATRFTDAYGNLLASLREARQLNQMDADLRHRLRPVHRTIVDAGTLIQSSPWEQLTKENQPPSQIHSRAQTPLQNGFHASHAQSTSAGQYATPPMASQNPLHHRRAKGSNGSGGDATLSPQNASVPATPMAAALGPAAQATVPNPSVGAGSLAGMFEGNVFQRADNLLHQEQTMFRRPAGAP